MKFVLKFVTHKEEIVDTSVKQFAIQDPNVQQMFLAFKKLKFIVTVTLEALRSNVDKN